MGMIMLDSAIGGCRKIMEKSSLFYLMICIQISTPSQVYPTDSWYSQPHCHKSVCLKGQSNELKNPLCHLTKNQLSSTLFQPYFNTYSKTDLTKVLHAGTRILRLTGGTERPSRFLEQSSETLL